jgi:hypothetical protein
MGIAAVPGDDEHEAIRILDTHEHLDVLAAAIVSEDLRTWASLTKAGRWALFTLSQVISLTLTVHPFLSLD